MKKECEVCGYLEVDETYYFYFDAFYGFEKDYQSRQYNYTYHCDIRCCEYCEGDVKVVIPKYLPKEQHKKWMLDFLRKGNKEWMQKKQLKKICKT